MDRKNAKKIITIVVMSFAGVVLNFAAIKYSADTAVKTRAMSPLAKYAAQGIDFIPGELIVETKGQAVITTASEATKSNNTSIKEVQTIDALAGKYKIKIDIGKAPVTMGKAADRYSLAKERIAQITAAMGGYVRPYIGDRIAARATREALADLNDGGMYASVSLNHIYQASSLPNDKYINSSGDGTTWSKNLFGEYEDMWGLKQNQVDQAWNFSTGKSIIVAVVDTGVDTEHPDLHGNILTTENSPLNQAIKGGVPTPSSGHVIGYNFADDNEDVTDRFGHGTHVAGTIAAIKNNSEGIAGVAPDSKIMPVKVLDDSGYGTDISVAKGIKFAADNGAKVINMSLGGWGSSAEITSAVKYATAKGALVIVAAGNDGADAGAYNPASDPNVITVAASTEKKGTAYFSNYGTSVDVAAPGGGSIIGSGANSWADLVFYNPNVDNIVSTMASSSRISRIVGDAGYSKLAGTSMATPFVSGTAALILAQHPDYTADQVKSIIYKSATDITDVFADGSANYPGWDPYTGYGIVNPKKALVTAPSSLPIAVINGASVEPINPLTRTTDYAIRGSAGGDNFSNYKVFYSYANFNNQDYYPTDWVKINDSSRGVTNNLLATLSKSVFSEAGDNTAIFIRLLSTGRDGMTRDSVKRLLLTKGEVAGFPKISNSSIIESVPYDLNADGKTDLLYTDYDGNLRSVSSEGKELVNWKKDADEGWGYSQPVIIINGESKKLALHSINWSGEAKIDLFDLKTGASSLSSINVPNPTVRNFSLTTVKNGSKEILAYNWGDKVSFYSNAGKLLKSISAVYSFSTSAADLNKDGYEELITGGYRVILGQVRAGVFAINTKDWSIKNLYLENTVNSPKSIYLDIRTGDINNDGSIEIVADNTSIGGFRDKLITLSNTGSLLKSKTFNSSPMAGWFEPPAFYLNDLSDVDNDNKAEIGLYNFEEGQIQYYNKDLIKISGFDSTSYSWRAIDADNTDNYKEVLTINTLREGAGWYRGVERYLKIKKLDGKAFKQFNLTGSPDYAASQYFSTGSDQKTATFISSWGPETSLLHRYAFPTQIKNAWPMDGHDIRKTNNYSAKP